MEHENGFIARAEFPVIPGLSPEYQDHEQYETALQGFLQEVTPMLHLWAATDFFIHEAYLRFIEGWQDYPSFIFGLETLLLSIRAQGSDVLFATLFTQSRTTIPINGLVWMGTLEQMRSQAKEKIAAGFQTVKLKIGALDWPQEWKLLQELRAIAGPKELTIRVDANGAFTQAQAADVLAQLALLDVHSIEQPIRAGQVEQMAQLCKQTPVPIALDEELIGVVGRDQKAALLDAIQAQNIILKPSLHGGFSGVREWISLAEQRNIGWWLTSALESSIGLNAIVQFGACYELVLPQGFGTGGLYTNNLPTRLRIQNGAICWT